MTLAVSIFLVLATALSVSAGRRGGRAIWRGLARVSGWPIGAMALVFIVSGALYSVPWMLGQVRPALVHDEVSNLLAADTFRHGRLTNPSPPFWESFESLHVIVMPTYASKFPPGLGLIYALGWIIGSPRIGAILAGALAAVATAWMLRARMSWRLAVMGALVVALLPMVFGWTQGFWGGNLPMLGAALFVGAAWRFRSDASRASPASRFSHGAIAGVGLSILANTRPFEGLLLAILLFVAELARPMFRAPRAGARFIVGASLVLIPVIAWMGYYNYRITRDMFQMPYALHARQYMVAPILFWQDTNTPTRTENGYISAFHSQIEFREYDSQRTVPGFLRLAMQRFGLVLMESLYPLVGVVVLVGGGFALRYSRTARQALLIPLCFIVLHMVATPWLRPHYLAPIVPLWAMFVALSLRRTRRIRIVRVPAIALALVIASATYALLTTIRTVKSANTVLDGRTAILNAVEKIPGKHMVFVMHLPGAQPELQFVHNPADIDAAPVLFVHARDGDANAALANHYMDRSIWTLTVSANDATLRLTANRAK